MVTIRLYKGAFTQKYTVIEAEAGKKIADYLATDKCAVIVNKRPQKPDYVIQEGDEIVVREYYGGVVVGIVTTVTAIITAATLAIGATALILYAACPAFRKWIQGLFGANQTSDDEFKENPTISGTSNQSAKDKPVPLILGKRLLTPYYVGKPYRTPYGTYGENQYYTVLFMLGYKPLNVTNIRLKYADLISNENKRMNVTFGKSDVDGTAFNSIADTVTANLVDEGECSLYDQKIIQDDVNSQIQHVSGHDAEWVVRYSTFNPMSIEVEVMFEGLYELDDSGDREKKSCQLQFQYSFDGKTYSNFGLTGGAQKSTTTITQTTYVDSYGYTRTGSGITSTTTYYHEVEYDSSTGYTTFKMNQNQTMYFVARKDFTYNELKGMIEGSDPNFVYIRVRRVDEDTTENTVCDKAYLSCVRTYCFDKTKSREAGELVKQAPVEESLRDKTVRLAIRIKASNWLSGSIDSLNCIVSSLSRTWNGIEWSGEEETSNPASLALLLFGHPTLGIHAYPDSKLDLAKFGELYEYCERCGFEYNGILTSQSRFGDVLQKVLEAGHAYPTLGDSQYSLYIDKPQTDPVMILNNHNILSDGLTNSKDFEELPDGLLIKFVNADADYQEDTIKCLFSDTDSEKADLNLETVTYDGITNSALAWRMGKYTLAKRKLRPETWIRKVSVEGALVNPGDLVELQDDTISVGIGDGGIVQSLIIENGNTVGFIVDSMIAINSAEGEKGVKIIHEDGSVTTHVLKESDADITQEFYFKEGGEVQKGDACVFGIVDNITTLALCISKKSNEDGTHELTLVPYQEGVYDYDEEPYPEEIPEFEDNLTVQKGITSDLPDNRLSIADIGGIYSEETKAGTDLVGAPDAPYFTWVVARQDCIHLEYSQDGIGLANNIKCFVIMASFDGGYSWEIIGSTPNRSFDYMFYDYFEAEDFADWRFQLYCVNTYSTTENHDIINEDGELEKNPHASDYSEMWAVDTSFYGTWKLNPPDISVKVSDRTIILTLSQPARADNRTVYGAVRYKVQIRRPDIDDEGVWWKPATSSDPYASEENYKDGEGYVSSDSQYVQTVPLAGQDISDNETGVYEITNTLYQFNVCAYNEANDTEWVVVNATALFTSIRDFVYANATEKELIVWDLTALSARLGMIKDGVEATNNFWNLETGEFRVGDENNYLYVIPLDQFGEYTDKKYEIVSYDIVFKVGNFEVSSNVTSITGDLSIYREDDNLNRAFISPTKISLQHRYSVNDEWFDCTWLTQAGVFCTYVKSSDGRLTITNASDATLRLNGLDYGTPLLSENGHVYHFDDNELDQNNETELTITTGEGGMRGLFGAETTGYKIDFTPAILAYAPYYENSKCLYGQFSVNATLQASNTWTIDFWVQFLQVDNQTIFSISDGVVSVRFAVNAEEVRYNEKKDSEPYYNKTQASKTGQGFTELDVNGEPYFYLDDNYNEKDENEVYYNKMALEDYDVNYSYYQMDEDGLFYFVDVTIYTYEDMVIVGLFTYTGVPYNTPGNPVQGVYWTSPSGSGYIDLDEMGIGLNIGQWYHFGIVRNLDNVSVYIDNQLFANEIVDAGEAEREVTLSMNPSYYDFLIDELMYDMTVAEPFDTFTEHTKERKPWGSLSDEDDWFILWANDVNKVKTNLFDTPNFDEAVERILRNKGLIGD